jgi:hypothetical protein
MAAAEVGDDVFGEDPTVARLEARVAGVARTRGGVVHTRPVPWPISWVCACTWRRAGSSSRTRWPTSCAPNSVRQQPFRALRHGPGCPHRGRVLARAGPLADGRGRRHLPRADGPRSRWRTRTTSAAARSCHCATIEAIRAGSQPHGVAMHLDGARLWNAQRRHRRGARGIRPVVRHRLGLPLEGTRGADRVGSGRVGCGDARGTRLAQAVWRGDAPSRHPRRRGVLRPRSQHCAACRRSRPRAALRRRRDRGGSRRGPPPRWRQISSSWTWVVVRT